MPSTLTQAVFDRCTKNTNYRVVVEPEPPFLGLTFGTSESIQCEQIAGEIRRHVDGIGSVCVEHDSVCVFCGAKWETATAANKSLPTGQPLCCDRATEVFDRALISPPATP